MTSRVTLPIAVALSTTLSPTPATSLQQQTWSATLEAESDPGLHLRKGNRARRRFEPGGCL